MAEESMGGKGGVIGTEEIPGQLCEMTWTNVRKGEWGEVNQSVQMLV
jgi:hypothetical protein